MASYVMDNEELLFPDFTNSDDVFAIEIELFKSSPDDTITQ